MTAIAIASVDSHRIAPGGRRGAIVVITTARGTRGYGEASPLPGRSTDDVDDAVAAVAALRARLPIILDGDAADAAAIAAAVTTAPAARFAIETALLDAIARDRGVSIAEVLVERPAPAVPINALAADAVGARAAVARGIATIKVKLGAADDARARLSELRAAVGAGVAIRVDLNRAWPTAVAVTRLEALADLGLEYVEEPCPEIAAILGASTIPIALDETVAERDDATIARLLAHGGVAAIVVKPTVVGGLGRSLALARLAASRGVDAVVTHAFEGPIATAACAELARAIGGTRAVGLDRHAGLAPWRRTAIPQLAEAAVIAAMTPGLGLAPDELAADLAELAAGPDVRAPSSTGARPRRPRAPTAAVAGDELSLAAAARDAGARPAILAGDMSLRFADLAAAVPPRPPGAGPIEILAHPAVSTVAEIITAIDARRPIILVHPSLPAAQRQRQLAAARALVLPVDTLAVVFTSGSSGEPRPIALGRRQAIAAATASAAHLGWRDDDAWLVCLPLAHVGGLAIVVRCLAARRPIIVAAPGDPIAYAHATLASLVPAQLAGLDRPPPRLRAALIGGAASSRAVTAAAVGRGIPILTTYGLTETWGQVVTQPVDRAGLLDDGVGVALPGVAITAGTAAAPGPIVIHGPMCPGGAIATADLGHVDGRGWLHVAGRADDVIVSGGENVHPATVEDVLSGAPGVADACVFGADDPRWGQRVVAAVVLEPAADLGRVVAHARDRLAPFQRPRDWRVVDALPRTANGKPDRRAASAAYGRTRVTAPRP